MYFNLESTIGNFFYSNLNTCYQESNKNEFIIFVQFNKYILNLQVYNIYYITQLNKFEDLGW
jgi:hypothetical protein